MEAYVKFSIGYQLPDEEAGQSVVDLVHVPRPYRRGVLPWPGLPSGRAAVGGSAGICRTGRRSARLEDDLVRLHEDGRAAGLAVQRQLLRPARGQL